MTCEDCIHFKKIEYPKGVHLPEGDISLTHGICTTAKPKIWIKPSNNACRTFKPKEMTCQDCKYFNPNIRIKPEWVNQGLCEKRLTNGYAEYPTFDCEICGMFQPKEDSWESVSK